jgi:bacterioferritin
MNGRDKLIHLLNARLAEELVSSSQALAHAAMCTNWGYRGLGHMLRSVASSERKHVVELIGRIMCLEGGPVVARALPLRLGADVGELLSGMLGDSVKSVRSYGEALELSADLGDQQTSKMLARITQGEQDHADWATVQLGLIDQLGLETYQASVIARQISPHMQVYAGGELPAVLIGTVSGVYRHRYIKLHRHDAEDHQRRYLPLEWVEYIAGDVVRLSKKADDVRSEWLLKDATSRAAPVKPDAVQREVRSAQAAT